MGKIFFLMGKSASGKDTLYNSLLESLDLKPYVGYTTRPIRNGETDGVQYHFSTVEEMNAFETQGKLIEKRVYHTVFGDWFYFSVNDGTVDSAADDYLYIGTLESYVKMRDYFGEDRIVPLYIEVEDGLRLERAIKRERTQKQPAYEELCRRFLGDAADFSEENLKKAGIKKRYQNIDKEQCLSELKREITSLCQK